MRGFAILALAALAWAAPASAETKIGKYGRWIVDKEGEWVEAWTDNESGSEFGLICASGCMIYLDFRIKCEDGQDYPAMVNSGAGSLAISMRCLHFRDRQVFITEAVGEYVDMLQQGEQVGFAFPLDGGQFRVARFSTQGGYEAMLAALRVAMKSGTLKQAPKDVSI